MNQLEQYREQCAKAGRDFIAQESDNECLAIGVMEHIDSLPLPEATEKPAGYFKGDQDGNLIWSEDCVSEDPVYDHDYGDGFVNVSIPFYVLPPDAEALRKENQRLSTVEYCFNEWLEKTKWVQETVQPHELGMHRADVLKNRIDALREVLKEALDLMEYNADYFPESGAEDRSTIEKIKAVLGITIPQPKTAAGHVIFKTDGMMIASDPDGHIRVEMSALDDEGAA